MDRRAASGREVTILEKQYRSPRERKEAGVTSKLRRASECRLQVWCALPSRYDMLKGHDSTMGTARNGNGGEWS